MKGEQTWDEYMQPILITVSQEGRVFVVGWPSGDKQMSKYRHPRYGYAAFEWKSGVFERVPFLSIPEELRREENIVRCLPRVDVLTWGEKQKAGCDKRGSYLPGETKVIDIEYMKRWAMSQAARYNIEPLSD
jgi:hypothetical protein